MYFISFYLKPAPAVKYPPSAVIFICVFMGAQSTILRPQLEGESNVCLRWFLLREPRLGRSSDDFYLYRCYILKVYHIFAARLNGDARTNEPQSGGKGERERAEGKALSVRGERSGGALLPGGGDANWRQTEVLLQILHNVL